MRYVLVLMVWFCLSTPSPAQDFVLREHLGHTWLHELVTFPLQPAQLDALRQGAQVVGPKDEVLPSQIVETSPPRLAFQVTLSPHAEQTYRLDRSAKAKGGDLEVKEADDRVVIGNGQIGIALRKKLQGNEAPIAGIRTRSGAWTAGSSRDGGDKILDYSVKVTARGPVYADVVCETTFEDKGKWTLQVRVLSGEPVVLIRESFDAPSGGTIRLPLSGNDFQPKGLLYRKGMGDLGRLDSWSIAPGRAYTLEPWLRWYISERQGNWFAVHDEKNLLMLAALRPSDWRDPDWKGKAAQLAPVIPITTAKDELYAEMPLGGGSRVWMVGTPARDESLTPLQGKNLRIAPLPQRYLIKHGDFPLDTVKDYVLEWKGDHDNYPRLFVKKTGLPALRAKLKNDPNEVKRWTSDQPIDKYNIDAPLQAYFASQDAKLGEAIVQKNREWLTLMIDGVLEQNERVTLGVAPHMQSVLLLPTINLADGILGSDAVKPEVRKQMLAQLAFLGYAVNRDDYWSPARGFAANPNMTTTVALYQTAFASLLSSHPKAREWANRGLTELRRQLYAWSDEDGGWLEAPHYAMVAFDHMIGAFLMASNAGLSKDLHDDRVRKVIEWLAKISTPRDRRTGGFRHYPPIGNTYMGEGTGMFGIVAGLWKERDPKFAAEMQWMCEEHGSPPVGLFGPFATLAGYRSLLKSHDVAPKVPSYGSEWFRKTGVVLRHGFGSDRESYLHLIAGSQHDHYDFDSGSIVLWGKGRLLADDFGYIGRHPAKWHSMLTSSAVADDATMTIETFAPGKGLDYVAGKKGAWQRQIAFVKDVDPAGSSGFLIRDTHDADAAATWRLWLTAKKVTVHTAGATVKGEDDVDLEIYLHDASNLDLKTEETTQKGMGRREGKEGLTETRQTALLATRKGKGTVAAFLYPRLKTETAPKVTWFANGSGVQVETTAGTDYLFVNSVQAEGLSADKKVTFNTQAGAVQLRQKSATLTLGTAGKIRHGDKILESSKATARTDAR